MQAAIITPLASRKRGRPTKYVPGGLVFLEAYLGGCRDVFDTSARRWHVRLPTIDGFALYLGVHRDTLYAWAKIHPEYEYALEKLMRIQYLRLLNGGLSGQYQSWLVVLMLTRNHRRRFMSGQQ